MERKHPKLAQRFTSHQYLSIEAAFASQIITMGVYDAPSLEVATRIVDLVMVSGFQAVMDLIASQIECSMHTIMSLDEDELMEFFRGPMAKDVFAQKSIKALLKHKKVRLTHL